MSLRSVRRLAAAIVCFAWIVAGPRAFAQRTSTTADQEARALFAAGQVAVDEGRYAAAIDYFQRAYELSRRPALLFNLASAAEHMRRDQLALDAYRAYVDAVPGAPNRTIVEARIRVLAMVVAGEPVVPAPEDVANFDAALAAGARAPSEPTNDESGAPALPGALLGAGAALAVGGAVFAVLGAHDRATVERAADGTPWSDVAAADARAARRSITGASMLGAGATCLVTGLVLAMRREDRPAPTHGVGMDVAVHGAEASLWWSF